MGARQTEHQPPQQPQPLACGYLWMTQPDEAEISRLRQALGTYCQQHGYRLVMIFCDRDIRATDLVLQG
jgi:hypothetical protein